MSKKIKIAIVLFLVFVVMIGVGFLIFSNKNERKTEITKTSLEVTKVKIANLPIVQGLPVYLALEKGYFKDVGLDVQLIKFQSPNQIIDALLNGQVDLVSPSGAMGIIGIANLKQGGKLKIYAAAGGDDEIQNDAILVKNNSLIKNIEDLKGKKMGILPGIQWRTIAKDILAKNGLKIGSEKDKVTLVELAPSLQVQALASGQIDSLLGVEPIPTIVKVKKIGKELIKKVTVKNISNPFYGGGGAIRSDFIKNNPDTTKKILEVLKKSINEINKNPNKARKYLKNYTPLNNETILKVPISKIKMYTDFTKQDIESVQKFYDIFLENNVVKNKINFEESIYNQND